ncbi:hypothetical protein C8R42DRAFT_645652 [Lentinula raphanica]|nr:hypothetical protein C8R42DRAFT_645652 [Lentinula raphanica]
MCRDLRFIHLMIIALILMGAVNSAPAPQRPNWFSRFKSQSRRPDLEAALGPQTIASGSSSSQLASQPASQKWVYILSQYRKEYPDWETLDDAELQARIMASMATVFNEPGYLLAELYFMHSPGESVEQQPFLDLVRGTADVTDDQQADLGEMVRTWVLSLPVRIPFEKVENVETRYNRKLTPEDKYGAFRWIYVYHAPRVRPAFVIEELGGIKLPWAKYSKDLEPYTLALTCIVVVAMLRLSTAGTTVISDNPPMGGLIIVALRINLQPPPPPCLPFATRHIAFAHRNSNRLNCETHRSFYEDHLFYDTYDTYDTYQNSTQWLIVSTASRYVSTASRYVFPAVRRNLWPKSDSEYDNVPLNNPTREYDVERRVYERRVAKWDAVNPRNESSEREITQEPKGMVHMSTGSVANTTAVPEA